MRRLVLAALVLAWPGMALAHPHILIDAHAVIEFNEGRIVGLRMAWKFDSAYSSSLVEDFDTDKDKRFSPAETKALETGAFQDSRNQGYFTVAAVDGKPVTWPAASDFQIAVAGNALIYTFRLALPQPVDPRRQAFKLSTFEESFYVDVDFRNDAAIALTGDGAERCRFTRGPDHANAVWGGALLPTKVEVTCK
ncbi:MAG: DUF1007 family protein [Magnetospirillum sp.]|nr:DUF1007 family protein [Magnetospirillum sp.]